MKYTLAMLAAAAAVQASPFPQAVTASIAPEAPAPSGCSPNYSGTFGIAVMNVTAPAAGGAPPPAVTSLPDGQPQATTGVPAVTTLPDGQPQATTGVPAVSTIADGQPQAPTMSVVPVTQISDGQIQATTMMPINQIGDGQIQNTVPAVSTIADGQPQAPTGAPPVPAVSTIADGQPQAPTGVPAVSTIADGQPQAPTGVPAVSTIADGQPQAPTGVPPPPPAPAVSTIADGQPQAPTGAPAVSTIADGQPQAPTGAPAVSTIADGQPQAPTAAVSTIADGQPQASASASAGGSKQVSNHMVACNGSSTLQVTLNNGVLTDNQGRTGYIASNYQFQFDGPPQAGAIYTAGFSVCGNGSLALGGSSVFYQCLSGNFYNLYDRHWAAQCNPITINVVKLIDCP